MLSGLVAAPGLAFIGGPRLALLPYAGTLVARESLRKGIVFLIQVLILIW